MSDFIEIDDSSFVFRMVIVLSFSPFADAKSQAVWKMIVDDF